jgi:DNA-binding transcriptional LysR family regulator
LYLAVSRDHPLASRASIPLRGVNGSTLITMRLERAGGFYDEIFAPLQSDGVRAASIVETPDIETCISLVASGLGVAFVSSVTRALQFERITYRPLSPKTTIETLAIARRRERSNAPAVRAFVEHVRDTRLSFVV